MIIEELVEKMRLTDGKNMMEYYDEFIMRILTHSIGWAGITMCSAACY